MKTYQPPWYERATMPDLITRGLNVGSGGVLQAPDVSGTGAPAPDAGPPMAPWLTNPGMRPTVLQRFVNFQVTANTPAVRVSDSRFECIGVILNIYSTAGASAFWGAPGVTVTTGIEIRPGIPAFIGLDQDREMWELQRQLEHMGAMMASQGGFEIMAPYMAPRVIIDLNAIALASVAAQPVAILAFLAPEYQ